MLPEISGKFTHLASCRTSLTLKRAVDPLFPHFRVRIQHPTTNWEVSYIQVDTVIHFWKPNHGHACAAKEEGNDLNHWFRPARKPKWNNYITITYGVMDKNEGKMLLGLDFYLEYWRSPWDTLTCSYFCMNKSISSDS